MAVRSPAPSRFAGRRLQELARVDQAVYEAIAATPTPSLDGAMRRLSIAANYSRLSIAASAILVLGCGSRGRRAAASGLVSVVATSAIVNLGLKPLAGRRHRPDRAAAEVPAARQVPMPGSRSFPSGHTASAVAFASGVGSVMPLAALPLHALAATVGYSRVHTGVHYPADVLAGAMLGAMISDLTTSLLPPCGSPRRSRSCRAR